MGNARFSDDFKRELARVTVNGGAILGHTISGSLASRVKTTLVSSVISDLPWLATQAFMDTARVVSGALSSSTGGFETIYGCDAPAIINHPAPTDVCK